MKASKGTIIIKESGKKEIKIKFAEGYFLIISDPNGFKGIKFSSSHMNSVPRMRGWVEWARDWLVWSAHKVHDLGWEKKKK